MSLYKGTQLVAGGRQTMPLLSFMWADHQLNDISWLRADTFSWQSGAVYTAVYQHLVDDYNNIPTEATVYVYHSSSPVGYFYRDSYFDVNGASHPYAYARYNSDGSIKVLYADHQTGETTDNYYENADGSGTYYSGGFTSGTRNIRPVKHETINGNIISFYEAQDGHKIAPDKDTLGTINELPVSQESNVAAIYAATGVAWYYVLDTTNQRFKLPRTQFAFTGIRTGVGNYVDAGLPDITAEFVSTNTWGGGLYLSGAAELVGSYSNGGFGGGNGRSNSNGTVAIKASNSSTVYGNSDTVQPPATEMYLYFYVGQFTQTAIEQTAGINAETLNGKVDKGHQVIEYQEPTSANNYTWYRKYADGWVEQGGKQITPTNANNWATTTITLPVVMANTNYNVYVANCNLTNGAYGSGGAASTTDRTTTSFVYSQYNVNGGSDTPLEWEVKGIAA